MISTSRPSRRQSGVVIVEVLVAFLILSISVIGYSSLQVHATKASQSNLQRTDAIILATSIIDAMHANRVEAVSTGGSKYNKTSLCSVPPVTSPPTLASNDLHDWLASLQKSLGSGACATIECGANNFCQVDITWDDSRALGGSTTQKLQLVTQL